MADCAASESAVRNFKGVAIVDVLKSHMKNNFGGFGFHHRFASGRGVNTTTRTSTTKQKVYQV